jgi:hypothetical protein
MAPQEGTTAGGVVYNASDADLQPLMIWQGWALAAVPRILHGCHERTKQCIGHAGGSG